MCGTWNSIATAHWKANGSYYFHCCYFVTCKYAINKKKCWYILEAVSGKFIYICTQIVYIFEFCLSCMNTCLMWLKLWLLEIQEKIIWMQNELLLFLVRIPIQYIFIYIYFPIFFYRIRLIGDKIYSTKCWTTLRTNFACGRSRRKWFDSYFLIYAGGVKHYFLHKFREWNLHFASRTSYR